MKRADKIPSMGKILDRIKGKQTDPSVSDGKIKPRRGTGKLNLKIAPMIGIRKSANIGIDIGHDCLRLVKASRSQGGVWRIDEIGKRDIPANTPRNSPEFGVF